MKREWKSGKPPHRTVVEVKDGREIIRVRAIWGSDGTLPHWESEDRMTLWAPTAFSQWREVAALSTPSQTEPQE